MIRESREAFTCLSSSSSTSFSSIQSATPFTTPNHHSNNNEDNNITSSTATADNSTIKFTSIDDPIAIETANRNAIVPHMSMFITLTPEEEELFKTLENAAIAYENHTLPLLTELEENEPKNDNDNQEKEKSKPSNDKNKSNKKSKNNNNSNSNNKAAKQKGELEIIMPETPPERIEIRVAGGWVRDKILNLCSDDIDLALDTLSGLQYASIVQRYLLHQEQQKQEKLKLQAQNDNEDGTETETEPTNKSNEDDGKNNKNKDKKKKKKKSNKPKIAVIAANPDQSKHLETATMRINTIDVDFVHLRGGETYTSDSRIPTLKENATPLDDALRRDFTINALFYNLRKKQVEDYTGRGIQDLLVNKTLVTPIDANLTFHDDPLRVLRAIRFAVRYDLTLSDEIIKAARSTEVHDSLHVKVSRERVGKELEGMLSGKNAKPAKALEMMTFLKLAGCVFCFPPDGTPIFGTIGDCRDNDDDDEYSDYLKQDEKNINEDSDNTNGISSAANARRSGWEEASSLLKYTRPLLDAFGERLTQDGNTQSLSERVDIRLFYLSSFLYPFRKLTYLDKKKKSYLVTTFMIKESIKFANKDVTSITTIMENVDEMRSILSGYFHQDDNGNDTTTSVSSFCRLRIGLVLRRLKDLWVTTLLVATIAELRSNNFDKMDEGGDDGDDEDEDENSVKISCKTISFMLDLYQDIIRNNLDECWKLRPLLDGKAIVKSLELPRGPAVGTYLEEQVKWMLEHPDGSKNECEEHLRSVRKRELELSSSEGGDRKDGSNDNTKHCAKRAHT